MAIYRIFPDKDTIIFTEQNTGNAGKDEIIEVGGYPSSIDGVGQAARILIKFTTEDIKNVVDTLQIARSKYPGAQNSLDALCKRFNVDNSRREKHNALIDCHLLKEVYINLVDQKEPKLNLENNEIINPKFKNLNEKKDKISRIIIKPNNEEIDLHKKYLRSSLVKNYYK